MLPIHREAFLTKRGDLQGGDIEVPNAIHVRVLVYSAFPDPKATYHDVTMTYLHKIFVYRRS